MKKIHSLKTAPWAVLWMCAMLIFGGSASAAETEVIARARSFWVQAKQAGALSKPTTAQSSAPSLVQKDPPGIDAAMLGLKDLRFCNVTYVSPLSLGEPVSLGCLPKSTVNIERGYHFSGDPYNGTPPGVAYSGTVVNNYGSIVVVVVFSPTEDTVGLVYVEAALNVQKDGYPLELNTPEFYVLQGQGFPLDAFNTAGVLMAIRALDWAMSGNAVALGVLTASFKLAPFGSIK